MKHPLTANEFAILELLWKEGRSLSRPEIIEKTKGRDWNPNSIHLIMNNMIEKGVLHVDGLTRCGRGYGRTYAPTMTRMEYAASQIDEFTPDSVPAQRFLGVVAALVDNENVDSDTITSLEQLLDEETKGHNLK